MESPQPKRQRKSTTFRSKKIAIEGNIATGKSTFIKMLEAENPDWSVVPEPVARWTNVNSDDDQMSLSQKTGGNLLETFYTDPQRWAYTFESYTFIARMKEVCKKNLATKTSVQFFERSVYSSRYIFAQNCFENGVMTETEWNIYQDWSSYLLGALGEIRLDGVIYLRANPDVCYNRMQKRGRPEESGVSLEYLKQLNEKHEAWLYRNEVEVHETLKDIPILIINCDEEFVENPERSSAMMKEVKQFVGLGTIGNDSGIDSSNVSMNSFQDSGNSDIEY